MPPDDAEPLLRHRYLLGRILDIDIGVHYSWLVVALMIAVSLAGSFTVEHPEWGQTVAWASAVLAAALFFAALVLHELAHAFAARAQGLSVRSITLFALGGTARIDGEPADARAELRLAIAGPLTSILIGATCLAAVWAAVRSDPALADYPVLSIAERLGYVNLCLAAFNLIPGFPLDGGLVLRALLWRITGDPRRAARIASRIGRGVALLFMVAGVLWFAAGAGFGPLWLTFIGWFLFDAAGAATAKQRLAELLAGMRVGDLMIRDCPQVDAWANLETFASERDVLSARCCYIVVNQGRPVGLISAREVRIVPEPLRRYKTVHDAMRPLDQAFSVAPDLPVTEALAAMGRADVGQLPVSSGGQIEGVISRASVLGFLEAHSRQGS